MSQWFAAAALPARSQPDAGTPARDRIEQDTVLVEIERRGVWVHVETPDGQRFWVDGRRLQALPDPDRASPGETPPPEPTPPAPIPPAPAPSPPPPSPSPDPSSPSPASIAPEAKRRLPLPVIAVIVAAIGLVAVGAVLLRGDSASGPPSVLRGYIPLDFSPVQIGMEIPRNFAFLITDSERLAEIDLGKGQITISPIEAPGAVHVEALSGVGFNYAAKTSDSSVLLLYSYLPETEVALPHGCCADVLVGTDNGFIAFPEEDGRSDSYLEYDGSWNERPLPAPIMVTSAAFFDGFLYIGHTNGLVAVSPYDGCSDPVTLWDAPTAALAITHLDSPNRPTLSALDTQNRALAVVDPGTTRYHEMENCGQVEPPRLEEVIDIGDLAGTYQPALALIDATAYVIDTEGVVYIVDIGSGKAELIRDMPLPGGPGEGAALIAVPDWLENQWNVFVADPAGVRLWWIDANGVESPHGTIEPLRKGQP